MDQLSQQLSKIDIEEFNPEMSFSIILDNYQDKKDESQSIDLISNHIKKSLKKDLSESVMNLTQCFICLSVAKNPLTCPKCNNFACKDCLDKYFGEEEEKECPLCKNIIEKDKLKINKTIKEIEKILYSEKSKSNKIKELTKLVNEKKKKWEKQNPDLNNLINKIISYQENLRNYREKYELYFKTWKERIKTVFGLYEKKIEELIDLLMRYQEKYNNSITKSINNYNKIKEKSNISSKDISSLVNEVLTMERHYFNMKSNNNSSFNNIIQKSNQFFITPILIMPNISNYTLGTVYLGKKDLFKNINKKDYNVHIGYYQILHSFDTNKFTSSCRLYIKNDRDVSFFPIQKKVIDSKFYEIIPMKDVSDSNHFIYEAFVDLNELNNDEDEKTIRIETKIQIFSVIG